MVDCQLILSTCPDTEVAERIADTLVDQKLAACVNLVPGLRSVYRWKGQRERAEEVLLIIKSRTQDYSAVEKALRALHPYELPEIIAVPVSAGLPAYLAWLGRRGEEE